MNAEDECTITVKGCGGRKKVRALTADAIELAEAMELQGKVRTYGINLFQSELRMQLDGNYDQLQIFQQRFGVLCLRAGLPFKG